MFLTASAQRSLRVAVVAWRHAASLSSVENSSEINLARVGATLLSPHESQTKGRCE